MADVPDHLVPTDGLTNSIIHFGGLDARPDRAGAIMRFDIRDEAGSYLATFELDVDPNPSGSVDRMIADAHKSMVDILRQWLFVRDKMHQHYEKAADR